MDRVCKTCNTAETTKWFSGPLCRKCYRAQPHIKIKESESRLKKIDQYMEVAKKYRQNNIKKIKQKDSKWYRENKEDIAIKKSIYKNKNRLKLNEQVNSYQKMRRGQDIDFKLRCVVRSRLSKAIINNRKAGSAVSDLGCSIEELKRHLESQFQPGMTWDNYGRYGWHIDHIKALSKFNLTDPEEFREACHYTNLQPLWAEDNLRKGAS